MHLSAKRNEYADTVAWIFDDVPKAVFAAIAVSALTQGGSYLDDAMERVAHEWVTLHANGIVPQRPPATIRELAAKYETGLSPSRSRHARAADRLSPKIPVDKPKLLANLCMEDKNMTTKKASAAKIADLVRVIEEHGHYAEGLPDGAILVVSIGMDRNGVAFGDRDILPARHSAVRAWLGY